MKRLFLFLLFFYFRLSAYEYDLSVVAIFQNEARFMKEWIEYNKIIGVKHFWLYNNESNDNFDEVLEPYISSGLVELIDWPTQGEKKDFAGKTQAPAYMDAIARSIDKTEWLAMIDLDEFMVPKEGMSIPKILNKHFKNEVGLVLYWQMFGTSHIEKIEPNELMIEKLTMRAHKNHIIHTMFKTIVKPQMVRNVENPHHAHYISGMAVNTLKKPTHPLNEKQNYTINLIQLNHYWTRDIENILTVKWPRMQQYGWLDFKEFSKEYEMLNEEQDYEINKFIPILKKNMNR